jgi:hypothetical protein
VKKDKFQIVHLDYRVKYDNADYQKNAHPVREIIKNTVKQSGDWRRIFIIGDLIEEKNYRFKGNKKKEKNENFDSQKKKRVINIRYQKGRLFMSSVLHANQGRNDVKQV